MSWFGPDPVDLDSLPLADLVAYLQSEGFLQAQNKLTDLPQAQSLNLEAPGTSVPPDVDRIRWLRSSDGAVVADLSAFEVGGGNDTAQLMSYLNSGATSSVVNLRANNAASTGVPNHTASLVLQADAASSAMSIALVTPTTPVNRTFIDNQARSQFLQTPLTAMTASWGRVNANGTIYQAGSGDWTVGRNAAGDYTVTWGTAKSTIPTVLLTIDDGGTGGWTAYSNPGITTSIHVVTWSIAFGAKADMPFHFLATG